MPRSVLFKPDAWVQDGLEEMSAQYESRLIFYLPHPDGITIVRVLHAARDWWRLLDLEI